jgi:hypothetical protein
MADWVFQAATVIRPVYESHEQVVPKKPSFGRWRTDIRFQYGIAPPLLRMDLIEDPGLASFYAFRGFQGSNRPMPIEISAKLLEIAALVPLP